MTDNVSNNGVNGAPDDPCHDDGAQMTGAQVTGAQMAGSGGGAGTSAESTKVRRADVTTLLLWGAVVIACALVSAAGVMRWRTTQNVLVQLGEADQVDYSEPRSELRSDTAGAGVSNSILAAAPAALTKLGATLDDPRFGRLAGRQHAGLDEVIPINRRWQFSFAPGLTEVQYAQQLAALGVEFGVLAADGSVQYLTGVGTGKVKRRTGARKDDHRPYWTWDRGDLRRADRVLLSNAGLPISDEVVLHFLSPGTITKLEQLELDFQKRDPKDVLLTRFAFRRTFRGHEVLVDQQIER